MNYKILFVTKGGHAQGMGDIVGSLNLANSLNDLNNEISFIIEKNRESRHAISLLYNYLYEYETKEDFFNHDLFNNYFDIIIVNQLNTNEDYLRFLKNKCNWLVTVDDQGEACQLANARFNPLYKTPNCYYGAKYIPLAKIFQEYHQKEKNIEVLDYVLVTMGGSDTYGYTPQIISLLNEISFSRKLHIVLGPSFSHHKELEKVMEENKLNIQFHNNVNANQMADLIHNALFSICPGGLTSFEMACLGTPCILICGEPFEKETAEYLESFRTCINLKFDYQVDSEIFFQAIKTFENYETLKVYADNGKKLVDGLGSETIMKTIISDYKKQSF